MKELQRVLFWPFLAWGALLVLVGVVVLIAGEPSRLTTGVIAVGILFVVAAVVARSVHRWRGKTR